MKKNNTEGYIFDNRNLWIALNILADDSYEENLHHSELTAEFRTAKAVARQLLKYDENNGKDILSDKIFGSVFDLIQSPLIQVLYKYDQQRDLVNNGRFIK